MVHQPPAGARDLLPHDVNQKRWIESRLQQVFCNWGYQRIITPTIERLDTLTAGGTVDRASVIQLQSDEEPGLGLRPELTASIARAAATRLAEAAQPLRLYYMASVFRHEVQADVSRHLERYQAGVELLGAGSVLADAEILLLLTQALTALELPSPQAASRWTLLLGEADLTRSLLEPFPVALRKRVRQAIAHLDRIALETLPLEAALRERALVLLDLRGQPQQVFRRVDGLDLTGQQRQALERLKALVQLYETSLAEQASPLILDLSLIQPFDYYSGIVFEAVYPLENGVWTLGQGGRYDHLMALYHPERQGSAGIGFSLNIEELQQVLLVGGHLPQRPPTSQWLVVPTAETASAAALDQLKRLQAEHPQAGVELYLDPVTQPQTVRQFASQRSIAQLLWVEPNGQVKTEALEAIAP
jgi:ATP phosphoribosyltransferase regulatory subunit